ncbi:MAG TPA: hypothetical protein DHW82_03865 [Spirochaetia bacterium]|nr:MAG: hypothetical protein A2Y41_09000 [Spirochaetes bacterium GWB1_36_13]HCL56130.1 hypothetical protein [Spirochaetia bacterium]
MFLKEVLKWIEKEGTVSPDLLSEKSGISLEQVYFALDYWAGKGKITPSDPQKKDCSQGCKGCSCSLKK